MILQHFTNKLLHSPHCNNMILQHYYNSLLYNELIMTHIVNYIYIHSSIDKIINQRCAVPLCSMMKCTSSKLCIGHYTMIISHHYHLLQLYTVTVLIACNQYLMVKPPSSYLFISKLWTFCSVHVFTTATLQ